MKYISSHVFFILAVVTLPVYTALADGNRINPLHFPYVQQLEREIEYNLLLLQDKSAAIDNTQYHTFAYGQSISDTLFVEIGMLAVDDGGDSLTTDKYELELLYQLTEQGEFNNDWGLLFELERNTEVNSWEAGSTLIVLREWKNWTGLLNATLAYEWGSGIDAEIESHFSSQIKYRYKPVLEPTLELHKGQDTLAVGPALSGIVKLSGRKKLSWTSGIFFGMDATTADRNFLFSAEYEF